MPNWSKDMSIGNKMINARGETVFEKASFRNSIKNKRCLVIADSFYEWKKNFNKQTSSQNNNGVRRNICICRYLG